MATKGKSKAKKNVVAKDLTLKQHPAGVNGGQGWGKWEVNIGRPIYSTGA